MTHAYVIYKPTDKRCAGGRKQKRTRLKKKRYKYLNECAEIARGMLYEKYGCPPLGGIVEGVLMSESVEAGQMGLFFLSGLHG